jgi:hypothetical protein
MYSDEARALRRCQATTKRGEPCQRYAAWGDEQRRCASHGGRVPGKHLVGRTACPPCRCRAYDWPHRPGSGLCEWPNPPKYRLMLRHSTHSTAYHLVRRWRRGPAPLVGWRIFGRRRSL